MKFSKSKITSKLMLSYILAILLSLVAFALFYNQLSKFTSINSAFTDQTEQVFLISETITNLYEVEAIGRNLVKNTNKNRFKTYENKIDKINTAIENLIKKYPKNYQRVQINSIKDLLRRKKKNLEELTAIYKKKKKENFYEAAVKELKEVDPTFKDYKYTNRFKELEPHQRSYLIKLLNYSKTDNEDKISNKTVDSIAESVTNVLIKLAKKERSVQQFIELKEKEILENDHIITNQMRNMLSVMERKAIAFSSEKVAESNQILSRTYKIILFSTLLTLLTAVTFLYFINKDVEKNTEYNNALQLAKKNTEKALKSRENLMNMVTHDIRSPLNTIIGYLELLQQKPSALSGQKYIDEIHKSSDYMLHLVNDLLDFSKMESGKLSVEHINFQPKALIESAIQQALPKQPLKEIEISTYIDNELFNFFSGDPHRIKQIAINLISNAYKFTEQGYIKISANYVLDGKTPKLILKIEDSGIGISKHTQKSIFEAFEQETTAKQKFKGFGLGLYIAKSLIQLLGGSIQLSSQLNKGSIFTCSLPLYAPTTNKPKKIIHTSKKRNDIKVVLIDDAPSQLKFIEEIFTLYNIPFASFSITSKAIEYIKKEVPDMIFTDIQMPFIDGFQVLKIVKENPTTRHIPVIALTGNTTLTNACLLEKGFAKSFFKPYTPKLLINSLSEILHIHIPLNTTTHKHNNSLISEFYDLNELYGLVENDTFAMKKILTTFCEATSENLSFWNAAIKTKNNIELQRLAHKMNPMFVQIKASKVSTELRDIETWNTTKIDTIFFDKCNLLKSTIHKTLNHLQQQL